MSLVTQTVNISQRSDWKEIIDGEALKGAKEIVIANKTGGTEKAAQVFWKDTSGAVHHSETISIVSSPDQVGQQIQALAQLNATIANLCAETVDHVTSLWSWAGPQANDMPEVESNDPREWAHPNMLIDGYGSADSEEEHKAFNIAEHLGRAVTTANPGVYTVEAFNGLTESYFIETRNTGKTFDIEVGNDGFMAARGFAVSEGLGEGDDLSVLISGTGGNLGLSQGWNSETLTFNSGYLNTEVGHRHGLTDGGDDESCPLAEKVLARDREEWGESLEPFRLIGDRFEYLLAGGQDPDEECPTPESLIRDADENKILDAFIDNEKLKSGPAAVANYHLAYILRDAQEDDGRIDLRKVQEEQGTAANKLGLFPGEMAGSRLVEILKSNNWVSNEDLTSAARDGDKFALAILKNSFARSAKVLAEARDARDAIQKGVLLVNTGSLAEAAISIPDVQEAFLASYEEVKRFRPEIRIAGQTMDGMDDLAKAILQAQSATARSIFAS